MDRFLSEDMDSQVTHEILVRSGAAPNSAPRFQAAGITVRSENQHLAHLQVSHTTHPAHFQPRVRRILDRESGIIDRYHRAPKTMMSIFSNKNLLVISTSCGERHCLSSVKCHTFVLRVGHLHEVAVPLSASACRSSESIYIRP